MPESYVGAPRRVLVQGDAGLSAFSQMAPPLVPEVLSRANLLDAVRSAPPSAVILVEPFTGGALVPEPWICDLAAAAPLVPIVACTPFRPTHMQGITTLLAWGVTEIADVEFEATSASIRQRLLDTHAKPFKRRLEQRLSRRVSQNGLTLLRAAAAVAVDGGTSVGLASAVGCSDRTVPGWCAREGLPSPRRLLAWMRALLAVALLEERHRSIVQVARCAGFASDHPLRRALRELLGEDVAPRDRTFAGAMELLNAELRELRSRGPRGAPRGGAQ
jgi:AraC-like DNA-binding protein